MSLIHGCVVHGGGNVLAKAYKRYLIVFWHFVVHIYGLLARAYDPLDEFFDLLYGFNAPLVY
jgi:hypothetical protein